MTKVQIAALRRDREALLQFLQEEEVVHVVEEPLEQARKAVESNTGYFMAEVQFALEFLKSVRKELNVQEKRSFKHLFSGKPVASLEELETTFNELRIEELISTMHKLNESLVELQSRQQELEERLTLLQPWQTLTLTGADRQDSPHVRHFLTVITIRDEEQLASSLNAIEQAAWQEIGRTRNKNSTTFYVEVVARNSGIEQVERLLQQLNATQVEVDLNVEETISQRLEALAEKLTDTTERREALLAEARKLLTKENALQFAYDALLHRQERERTEQQATSLPYSVVLTGWVPKKWLDTLTGRLQRQFTGVAVEELEVSAGEKPPVLFDNSKLMQPFEAVTDIYGKPGYHEVDPSGALSLFFLVAFGLALTDAGYGIVLMAATFAAERFFRLKKDMRKMMRLMFYAGLATAIIGALTGGWFGVVLEELPPSALKDILLAIKLVDPIKSPLTLLGVAFAVGIVQLLFAWGVRGHHNWKTGNRSAVFLDDIPWITMVMFLLLWAAARQGIVAADLAGPLKWLAIANAGYLVATQGRTQKNPLVRAGAGALSLYGLVNFMSDTLSYSRLLALGLATGIIGLVVNLIASMVSESIPVVGVILAAVVLLVGHVFNLGINTLGAFIHSGRLQFVEFFPKFMEGGGMAYKPFGRVSKYVDNPKEFL